MDKTIYDYRDEQGNIIYSKIREASKRDISHKKFYWQSYKDGNVIYNSSGTRRVLYRLPTLVKAIKSNALIYLVEGEKDCETLEKYSLVATTAPTTKQWCDEFTHTLSGADVILLYDNDKAGIERRDLICEKLYGNVKQLRVVDLPGIEYRDSHGLDITDWFEMGNTVEDLKALVDQTPDYEPAENTDVSSVQERMLNPISVQDLFDLDIPEREMLLYPFLPSQGLVMLVAKRGVGKTHIALGIAYAVATGSTFLTWTAPKPKKVLYVDGEMPAFLMKERLKMLATMFPSTPTGEYLQILTPDLQDKPMPDLSRQKGREILEEYIKDFDLVILDNISCLFRSGYENESESWQEAQEWALNLRRQGKSVLFVHHAGKSGVQRGTSKREDILDAVIILKHSDDYKPEDGACFEVHFDKARHFTGPDARSFQAHLQENASAWEWTISDVPQEEEINKIAQMKTDGLTIRAICEQTRLTKSQVEYRLSKAKEKGLITAKKKIS